MRYRLCSDINHCPSCKDFRTLSTRRESLSLHGKHRRTRQPSFISFAIKSSRFVIGEPFCYCHDHELNNQRTVAPTRSLIPKYFNDWINLSLSSDNFLSKSHLPLLRVVICHSTTFASLYYHPLTHCMAYPMNPFFCFLYDDHREKSYLSIHSAKEVIRFARF